MKHSLALVLAASLLSFPALADTPEYTLTLKDHQFTPDTLEVPADTKVKLLVKNLDATPEEFEIYNPKRSKIIPANSEGSMLVGPFKPGEYKFEGEFNPKTAIGKIIVK
jgi:hypothetical protein